MKRLFYDLGTGAVLGVNDGGGALDATAVAAHAALGTGGEAAAKAALIRETFNDPTADASIGVLVNPTLPFGFVQSAWRVVDGALEPLE